MVEGSWLRSDRYQHGLPDGQVNGSVAGARLMCNVDGAVAMVSKVIEASDLPVTVKMRLGWD